MINFKVEYYNDIDKLKLKNLSCALHIADAIKNGVNINEQEFFAYSIFREQKHHHGWQTYSELSHRLPVRIKLFEEYFYIEQGKLISRFSDSNDTDNTITESVGVGASLSLISKFYNLIEADWEKIPVSGVKDLDFEIAASDHEIVEVEAKGAIVKDTSKLSEISDRARSIREKKVIQRHKKCNNNSLIGVIASIPYNTGQDNICRLLDPDSISLDISPEKYKLLARLSFYYRELKTITKSPLLIALINRINSIIRVSNYKELDGQPLVNIYGEKFDIPPSLIFSRSIVEHDIAFGEVIPLGNNEYYYYGFLFSIIDILIFQDFASITNLNIKTRNLGQSIIKASFRKATIEELDFGTHQLLENPQGIYYLYMMGDLSITTSGRVIGKCRLIEPHQIKNLTFR